MSNDMHTTRRSFLKSGALVATPIAAVAVPAAVFAEDGSKARLARLEDERAIEALNRDFLRRFNKGGAAQTAELFARGDAPELPGAITRLTIVDDDAPGELELADDGATASHRFACMAETESVLEGNETIVQMARFQGNYAVRTEKSRMLSAKYVRLPNGWAIEKIDFG